MPWEKSFDVENALERAMEVFWAKGYEATSIRDLLAAMEINKGSLYNAFGSKKELFTRAFLQYDRDHRQATLSQLEALDDPVAAIETVFDSVITEAEEDTDRKGCLLVNSALELPNHPPDVQEMVAGALREFERFFERSVQLAQKRGLIDRDLDAPQVAKSLLTHLVGLRVMARGAFTTDDLRGARTQALTLLSS